MRKYFKGMRLEYFESALVIHFDAAKLRREPEEVQVFIDELADECRRWLPIHLACGPTYSEQMSQRIKRGIRAAKERRRQQQES